MINHFNVKSDPKVAFFVPNHVILPGIQVIPPQNENRDTFVSLFFILVIQLVSFVIRLESSNPKWDLI